MYSYVLIYDITSLLPQASKVTGTASKTSVQVLPQRTINAFTKRVSWLQNSIGNTAIHDMSNFVVDGGSFMNGRIANIGDKSRQRPKKNNRRPDVGESGSHDQNCCIVWYHFLWYSHDSTGCSFLAVGWKYTERRRRPSLLSPDEPRQY